MEKIYHLKSPAYPQFRFEYHATVKALYLVHVGPVPERGELIGPNIATEGDAWNAALMWMRGYKTAKLEIRNVEQNRSLVA